ncbi:UDP-2,4-diacetamido-2,4,6-trideoxy-beta-L-altropyranose hydrolase [Geomonas sp. Red69]|uniref:UDP-2,4-diacetamido-2,4, 6-trideoxy-beta-L-altropyranose hydrolase n=1 Tax=Geomonas diazotrophica TaxID=2843197 RepID=A0ABX8JI42_9BACT|nr:MULTISPECIES: UDP-2,4-diacetamido-2,4,6-trideoxy-beta-L-altropyranose hydrolase [Geomonas]MBU5635996.1 UDP-2,4-diacetamido-2,4,6-trideoxy-beta-L-altropyranose hydrolase [Geomonas diazotrophica]QWV96826.1 UDP-2,4-diacetamido-2,4,6-trideoxy-beta-L-altropyranose hydrolase [Geomonas nitrogeniifigens]
MAGGTNTSIKVVFRADSSVNIGAGHVMRCLTLAAALRDRGCTVSFISRDLTGNISANVEAAGFRMFRIPAGANPCPDVPFALDVPADVAQTAEILRQEQNVDWLVIDHYGIDATWETPLRSLVGHIMVIDDIANRKHDCDLILDQNLYENMESRYDGLVPENCAKFLGPRYALLRDEFVQARRSLRERDGSVKRVLVTFGGGDASNETAKALEAWRLVGREDVVVDVVVGAANPHREQLKQLCSELPNVSFYCNVSNMAQMMSEADLAVGAGGSTTWERCFLGLPSITLIVAENQAETTAAVGRRGATLNLGWYENVAAADLAAAIKQVIGTPEVMRDMIRESFVLMGDSASPGAVLLVERLLRKL